MIKLNLRNHLRDVNVDLEIILNCRRDVWLWNIESESLNLHNSCPGTNAQSLKTKDYSERCLRNVNVAISWTPDCST